MKRLLLPPARNTLGAWLARLWLPVFGLVFVALMVTWLYWVLGFGPVQIILVREKMGMAILVGTILWLIYSALLWIPASLLAWGCRAIWTRRAKRKPTDSAVQR